MSVCSPGPSAAVSLLQTSEKRNINLCLICQKLKDSSGSHKLTSTPDGRSKVVQTSKLLSDEFLHDLDESDFSNIQYHVNTMTIFCEFCFLADRSLFLKWPPSLIQYGGQLTISQRRAVTFL